MAIEVWKPVPGYVDYYEVSSFGRVRGLPRTLTNGAHLKGRLLSPARKRKGYFQIRLCMGQDHKWFGVHSLVLMAFVGPKPYGMECAHNNGNPSDNRLDNLRWDTRKGNLSDRERHRTLLRGERNNFAKLSSDDVRRVLKLHENGILGKDIADVMRVTPANISSIINRKTWSHIGGHK